MTEQAQESTVSQESVQESAPAQEQSQQVSNDFAIPEAYADRGWTKTVKSQDDLFQQFDNLQSKIGQRPEGIPSKDAAPEEWDKFYQALGRPETPDAYEFDLGDMEVPEGINLEPFEGKAKEFFYDLGLPADKANEAWKNYISMEIEGEQARQAELDKEFDDLSSSLFGEEFDDVSAKAQEYLKTNLPEELLPVVEKMGNNPKELLALIHVVNKTQGEVSEVKKEYGAEDKLQSGQQAAGVSVAELQQRMYDAKQRYQKAEVFSQSKKDAEQEINDLRAQMQRAVK